MFQPAVPVATVLQGIHNSEYVLAAIQRAGPADRRRQTREPRSRGPASWFNPLVRRHDVRKAFVAVCLFGGVIVGGSPLFAQNAPDGAAVYQKSCASCHQQPTAGSRAPTRDVLATIAPESILTSLTTALG